VKKQRIGSARRLRREATLAEALLWGKLRNRQLGGRKFRRQEPRAGFIADFVCLDRKLIIEVDGGQHAEQSEADAARTARLAEDGFRVLRYWNNDVMGNIEGVLADIEAALGAAPSPQPSPPGERERRCRARR